MIRNMIVGSIGFIGVGEGGCNIVNKFEKMGFKSYYINSAMKDLSKLDTKSDNTYHITDAKGCVRNRDKAKEYIKDNYDIILNNISQRMGNLSIIFIVFSMGGGTGSGMSPMLCNGLINQFPSISFGTISIVPDSISSSAKIKANACECYSELKRIKSKLGNMYFINNEMLSNSDGTIDYDILDSSFVSRFNDVVNVTDANGSVDHAEILELLSTNGNVIIGNLLPNIDVIEERLQTDLSFIEVTPKNEYLLYSISENCNEIKNIAESKFGIPVDSFIAYNDDVEFIASFGMNLPDETFNKLKDETKDIMSIRNSENEVDEFKLDDITSLFKSNVTKSVKEKSIKNSKDLLAQLEDF